jgi:hypothetical protein
MADCSEVYTNLFLCLSTTPFDLMIELSSSAKRFDLDTVIVTLLALCQVKLTSLSTRQEAQRTRDSNRIRVLQHMACHFVRNCFITGHNNFKM